MLFHFVCYQVTDKLIGLLVFVNHYYSSTIRSYIYISYNFKIQGNEDLTKSYHAYIIQKLWGGCDRRSRGAIKY